MRYFTTQLLFNLLVKEFLKLVNIWHLQAKWLTVLCTPFTLHFCLQRCWSRQISWITCVWQTETFTNCCCVNRPINVSLFSANIKLRSVDQFWLTDWQTDAISNWPTADHVWHFAATSFLCCVSCVQWVLGFFICQCKQLFVSELNKAYFSRHLF